jgi:hypothetical protein
MANQPRPGPMQAMLSDSSQKTQTPELTALSTIIIARVPRTQPSQVGPRGDAGEQGVESDEEPEVLSEKLASFVALDQGSGRNDGRESRGQIRGSGKDSDDHGTKCNKACSWVCNWRSKALCASARKQIQNKNMYGSYGLDMTANTAELVVNG